MIRTKIRQIIPLHLDRQAVVVVFGDSITFLSTFIGLMVLARVLSVENMGTFRQVTYLGLMIVSFFDMSLAASIYRFWNFYVGNERIVFIKFVVLFSFVLSLTASLILIFLASPVAKFYNNPSLAPALLVTSVFPLSFIPFSLIRPVMICRGQTLTATILETMASTVTTIAMIIPSWLGVDFIWALIIWSAISLIKTILAIYIFKGYLFAFSAKWQKNIFLDVWGYSGTLQISRIPGYIISYSDKIITSLFLSIEEFAVYSMGAREIPFINTVGYSVSNVIMPELARDFDVGKIEQACDRWRNISIKIAMFTYPVVAFCVWYATPLVMFLFSSTYKASGAIFQILSFVSFLRVIEFAGFAKAMRETKLIVYATTFGAIGMIAAAFPLTFVYKATGVAFSFFISTLISALYLLFGYRKILNLPVDAFFPWKRLLMLFFLSIGNVGIIDLFVGKKIFINEAVNTFELFWKLSFLLLISLLTYYALFWFCNNLVKMLTFLIFFFKRKFYNR